MINPKDTTNTNTENVKNEKSDSSSIDFVNINSFDSIVKGINEKIRKLAMSLKDTESEYKKSLHEQNLKTIEIIGIFSAILALIIIDINIILAAPNFLAAILLIIGLTASISILVIIMHQLFSASDKKNKSSTMLCVSLITLSMLVIIGIACYINKKDLYLNDNLHNGTNQSQQK